MRIRGLIFDCDGTLADTMPLHWEAWQAVTEKYGLIFPEERFYALGGVPSRDIFRMLSEEQGIALDPLVASKEKEDAYLVRLSEVGPVELTVSIARQHRGSIPMAVASGGTSEIINQVLEHLGIREWFDAVVTSESVTRQKPEPDIFLEAARQIDVCPSECRAYEDTDLGIRAIRAAGMEAIDVREWLAQRSAASE